MTAPDIHDAIIYHELFKSVALNQKLQMSESEKKQLWKMPRLIQKDIFIKNFVHTQRHISKLQRDMTHAINKISHLRVFPKITGPTRSFENTHTLIDNVFTNNIILCKPHISGILTHHVSDHFMSFCIVEGKIKSTRATP